MSKNGEQKRISGKAKLSTLRPFFISWILSISEILFFYNKNMNKLKTNPRKHWPADHSAAVGTTTCPNRLLLATSPVDVVVLFLEKSEGGR
jgi:hypothetical protein